MSTTSHYIHGTAPEEQARLAALNRMTNRPFVEFLAVERRSCVVEVGSGLGILAADVAAAAEGVSVVAVERSAQQLAEATVSPAVAYVRGDAHALPIRDASCHLAYARYVLEHVADPVLVAAEMRRILTPGGRAAFLENDTSLLRMDPPCPVFERAWSAFATLQERLGGDSFMGRRLFRVLQQAGFRHIVLSLQPDMHWQGEPAFAPWVRNIVGNLESARVALVDTGLCTNTLLDEAVAELDAHMARPDASSGFAWNRAMALR